MSQTKYLDRIDIENKRKMRETAAQDAAYIDGKCLLKDEAWTVAAAKDEQKAEKEAQVRFQDAQ